MEHLLFVVIYLCCCTQETIQRKCVRTSSTTPVPTLPFEEITTVSTEPPEPTMPDWMADEAKDIQRGNFESPMKYIQYVNDQDFYTNSYTSDYPIERCTDQLVRCVTTMLYLVPVCAVDNVGKKDYIYEKSYCKVYYYNCVLMQNKWRIVKTEQCPVSAGSFG